MPDSWLEIRPLPADPEALRASVTAEEWAKAAEMRPASRRTEWLAWRAVVRERLGMGVQIAYGPHGAPVLRESDGFIGVSHTKGWVAVVWSRGKCAVDIELAARDVSQTAGRFISEEERRLSDSSGPLFPVSVWCAKEALYKYSGTAGIDFRSDIRITASDIAAGRMSGTVRDGGEIGIELSYRDGLVAAVIY